MDNTINQLPIIFESLQKNIAEAEQIRRKRRLVFNLSQLEQGKFEVLKNGEFTKDVVGWLQAETSDNKERIRMLVILGQGIFSEEIEMRERALMVYSLIAEWSLEQGIKEIIFILADKFTEWLEFEKELLPGFEIMIKHMEALAEWFLRNALFEDAENIIERFSMIQTGRLEKSNTIKGIVSKSLVTLTRKEIVEKITDGYLFEDENQKTYKNILIFLGEKAATYLLNRVIQSHSRVERIALINLLPRFGATIVPVLKNLLESKPPWGVLRNVIYIVSELENDDELYSLIQPYFKHSDKRVQHEMICCVVKFGGSGMQQRLLEGLSSVDASLKVHLVRILVEQGERDDATFAAFCDLAAQKDTFPPAVEEELLRAIIAAFKYFPSDSTVKILQKMRRDYFEDKTKERIVFQIESVLSVLEPQLRHSRQHIDIPKENISFDSDPLRKQLAMKKVQEIEGEVRDFVRAGDSEQAGELIYSHAVDATVERDFITAEILRDRLLEINPMALAEVLQLGELIEEHKTTSITGHHIEIWRELYDEMTTGQFNALYYALVQENYKKGDIIIGAGETDCSLFFLNSGFVSVSCNSGGNEVFLKKMQPSDIIGSEQFFSTSVWTVTLKAFSEVQVHVLEYDVMKKISKEFPGLESKLKKYCQKYDKVQDLLEMSGSDRREYPRYPVSLMIENVLLDPFGNKGKRSFKGELLDISKAGLAFTIRITSNINAKLLLGRQINTAITINGEELPKCSGLIVGVRSHDAVRHDFSIHVKLAKKIDQIIFDSIIAVNN